MSSLSAVIITYNEEKNINRCIESLQDVADEIIILDSFSTDNTVVLAKQKGAVVYQQKFKGYIEQKNDAIQLANNDYVLCIDADEALDPVLIESIKAAKKHFGSDAYKINRCTNYCGHFIRHGSWYPDRRIRLFNKKKGSWSGINPHDKISLSKPYTAKKLKGEILHYSFETIEEHITQNNRFSTIAAEAYFKKGKKSGMIKLIFKPFWAFIKSYIIKLGVLDGFLGYVIAKSIAHMTFMKYYKLMALSKGMPLK